MSPVLVALITSLRVALEPGPAGRMFARSQSAGLPGARRWAVGEPLPSEQLALPAVSWGDT